MKGLKGSYDVSGDIPMSSDVPRVSFTALVLRWNSGFTLGEKESTLHAERFSFAGVHLGSTPSVSARGLIECGSCVIDVRKYTSSCGRMTSTLS